VSFYSYPAFACYDLLNGGKQKLDKTGLWEGDRFGQDTKLFGASYSSLVENLIGGQQVQAGALYSFSKYPKDSNGDAVVTIRFGLSFKSGEQACKNAEEEIGDFNFERTRKASYKEWNKKLNRIQLSAKSDATITELFYSSFYRQFLSPNNGTGESIGFKTNKPFFNSLYCTVRVGFLIQRLCTFSLFFSLQWDTYRTFYPLLSLHSPIDFASIVENYVDGWRKTGFIPECRANGVPGETPLNSQRRTG
jgi:putative alpha-1,2-mannosidase